MNMKKTICSLLLCSALQTVVAQSSPPVQVYIDLQRTAQTIHNFAASDAWACQFTGNWPDSKRVQLADWLFSMDTTRNGQPTGIGLSMWRFNIGAGSTEQGSNSGIGDEWRRAACFRNTDGTYNWQKQAGQLWFLQAAKARGVTRFLGFLNSPPVAFTRNSKAFADKGICNLTPDKYDSVGIFLRDVILGIQKNTGVTLSYISPVNEPQWDWSDGGQEGCPYNNEQIYGLTKAIDQQFSAAGIKSQLLIPEAGQFNYLYASENKPDKGMQVKAFFDPQSSTYVGHLKNIYHGIAAHSYFTTSPADTATAIRKRVVAALKGIPFWQSECCILGSNAGEMDGGKVDLGMDAALYIARVIHTDLTVANAAAWQWWLAMSPYDYKDGLIYIDKNKTDGQIHDTKMLWVLGNYSRFVRPGATRVSAALNDSAAAAHLLVSAYKNTDNSLNVVVINSSQTAANVAIQCRQLRAGSIRSYTTNAQGNLQPGYVPGRTLTVPPRSVVTLTGKINK
ncbi:MAG: xylanase [Chitinophaga sp.]|uniref:glycoside hydrolase n=1 Tax=Chitinophaga sp. TaxID=1869181 RepID=UPI001B034323|nr:glycoside hydrolase [Chitinophaga sp.]MBO9729428.1 xylanase [Chitinophaga sp.]